jgi:hypothetical protein
MFGHVLLAEYCCDFPQAVCSKVETDDHIPFLKLTDRIAIFIYMNNWLNELVCNPVIIGLLNGFQNIGVATSPTPLTIASYPILIRSHLLSRSMV